MAKEIAENQIHELTLTMPFDLTGQTLQLVYVDQSSNATISGATTTGASEGSDVTFSTDLESQGIDPGFYKLEVKYTENNQTRQLGLDEMTGDEMVWINDAVSVS